MTINAGVCPSYRMECFQGLHSASDTYMLALYPSSASLDPSVTSYVAAGEVSGLGYTAGGQQISGFSASLQTDANGHTYACLDFGNVTWPVSSFTARGGLIYNASKNNRAVTVLDFGTDSVASNGPFVVSMPQPGANTSLIRN